MSEDSDRILKALKGGPLFSSPIKGAGMDQSAILNMLMMPNKRPFIMGGGPSRATITGGYGNFPGVNRRIPWENSAKDLSDTAKYDLKTPLNTDLGTPIPDFKTFSGMPGQANENKTNLDKYNYALMEQALKKAGFDTTKMSDVEKVVAMMKLEGLWPNGDNNK